MTTGGHGTDLSKDERWDLTLLRGAERYQRWVLDSFGVRLHGRVLEIGAGNGNFTRWISRRADAVVVAEPDAEMCDEIETLGLPNVTVRCAAFQQLEGDPFDAVVMLNVLEHIDADLDALKVTRRLLAPGGALLLLVPAHPALFGTLDRRYDHHRRYTRDEVASLMTQAGYRLELCRYFNPLGAIGWWLVARVFKRKRLPATAVVVSERVAVPIGKRLKNPRFGQSVMAVGINPS